MMAAILLKTSIIVYSGKTPKMLSTCYISYYVRCDWAILGALFSNTAR